MRCGAGLKCETPECSLHLLPRCTRHVAVVVQVVPVRFVRPALLPCPETARARGSLDHEVVAGWNRAPDAVIGDDERTRSERRQPPGNTKQLDVAGAAGRAGGLVERGAQADRIFSEGLKK
jgi:hypothetical protein